MRGFAAFLGYLLLIGGLVWIICNFFFRSKEGRIDYSPPIALLVIAIVLFAVS